MVTTFIFVKCSFCKKHIQLKLHALDSVEEKKIILSSLIFIRPFIKFNSIGCDVKGLLKKINWYIV